MKIIKILLFIFLVVSLFQTKSINDLSSNINELSHLSNELECINHQLNKNTELIMKKIEENICDPEYEIIELQEFYYNSSIPLSIEMQKHIHNSASEHNINPEIIYEIIRTETQFQWIETIDTNGYMSIGYTQVNEINKTYLSEIDYKSEEGNIDACLYILSPLIGKYGTYDGLRAYNCGERGMLNGGGHYYATKILEGI